MIKKINADEGEQKKFFNRRIAIHKKCLDCSGGSHADITDCPYVKCPLYQFRIMKSKHNSVARERAIRKYCLNCMNGQVGEVLKCPSFNCPLFLFRMGKMDKSKKSAFFGEKNAIEGVS